ncbi:hypothetical protein TEA_014494 [Camellia sinensis var. sinensis]|uniref:NB-ARC domain-containing protein n=1 Tax=Camellia sinensis var. sinensis TaxID=542762 RepID=A0A4S4D738_CAMSN|nr:hypothetical protein TEA_014494 [Camellia sinensis var. sinensis]
MAITVVGVVGVVAPIVAKIGNFLMAPFNCQLGYVFCYNSKIKNLKEEADKLGEKRGAVQLSVNEAERNVKVIGPDVKGWQARADKCSEDARRILEATKKTIELAKLHKERKLTEVAYNEPPPGIESTSTEGIKDFKSLRLIMNDVMEALKDDRFHVIGICGIGGVGKTTMVKQVAKRATEENLFDEGETERGRANRLNQGLRRPKKFLVILEDVWNILELNGIGIPFGDGHKNCKILLTSRFDYVCDDMGAQTKFTIAALSTNEAWKLFKDMAGIFNDTSHTSTDLYFTQKAVATECGGLPVAIVTVARALKDKDRHSWDSALQQLSRSLVKNFKGVEEKVFKSLEMSYNYIESTEAKKCFLLCSLYPEDFNIPIEDLVRYGVGIEWFEAVDSVGEARDRVHAFIDDLKKGYLLMDSEVKSYVKMHDVIRDVAISIASREEHSFMVRCDKALKEWPEKERHKNYAVISMRCTGMSWLPDNLEFPELHLLQLEDNYASKLPKLPYSFYRGMKKLKALNMLNAYIERSLPTSLQWLTNLRSLSLYRCRQINDVSVIGALENLKILSFSGTRIKELPKDIGRLSLLKLPDLLRCGMKRICLGVLSRLSKLEELYLGSSFNDENSIEETKAIFTELGFLTNFTTLDVELTSFEYWPRDLVLTHLQTFVTILGSTLPTYYSSDYQFQNQVTLKIIHGNDLMESGFKIVFKITKQLHSTQVVGLKNVGYDLDKDGFKQLTALWLGKCEDLEYLIETTNGDVVQL